jgi:molybdopterin-guanine dinucleotide biosynthesis protein B
VLLLGNQRWALMHELRGAAEPPLDYLLDRLADCDLVLVEGFKGGDFPKLEVWRAGLGKAPLAPHWPGIVAVASENLDKLPEPLKTGSDLELLELADTVNLASFALERSASR